MVYNIDYRVAEKRLVVGDASIADVPSVQTVEPVGGADVQQYVTYVRLQDQAIYKDEVLRQTEEANVIVASSYNAVVKWSLRNSLFKYVRIRIKNSTHFWKGRIVVECIGPENRRPARVQGFESRSFLQEVFISKKK